MITARPVVVLVLFISCLLAAPAHAGWGDTLKKAGDAGSEALGLSLSSSQMETAFRELLVMGTDMAVENLSQDGGFSQISATTLGIPETYQKLGGSLAPKLLESLNQAAEDAIPAVGEVFKKTIATMKFANPSSLISGEDDAVTNYFEESARDTLAENTSSLIQEALEKAGTGTYLSGLQKLGSLSGVSFDPVDYLSDKVLDAMFVYIGDTEKGVRSGDVDVTSDLLKKLF